MHILAPAEGLDECGILGKVGEDPQLDLRIVGGEQQMTRGSDEGGAHAATECGADGDVLKIGVGGGEPSRGRDVLAKRSVNATRAGIDHLGQGVDVGRPQLGDPAVFEDQPGELMVLRQFFEHVVGGGECLRLLRLAAGLKTHLLEQDLPQLHRREDVEVLAGEGIDPLGQLVDLRTDLVGQCLQGLAVDQHAHPFHLGQDRGKRHLEVQEEIEQGVSLETRDQPRSEPDQNRGLATVPFRVVIGEQ